MKEPLPSLPSVELPSNIHADEPTDVDKLDRLTFAYAFANLAVLCETPLVIGIHGTWGTGKSSFMKMVERRIVNSHGNAVHTVWFDPWMHQFDDNPIIALAHALAASIKKPITGEIKKLLTVTAVAFGSGILNRLLGVGAKDVKELGDLYEEERFQIQEARTKLREHFEELTNKIKANTGKERLIFFIDDLDRCRPENALKLLEALKLYLNIKDCVYFLGVDHTALKHVIKEAFQGADKHEAEYLDKIVQLPFHIPPIDLEKGMKEYVDDLVKKERLEPCKEMLIHCLGDNPRQVKRFINTLTLNDLLAKEILKEEYDPKILAFVLLIQLLRHDLFRHLIRDYDLLKEVVVVEGWRKNDWEEDVNTFYNDYFANDERLRMATSLVGTLPEREVLERYLYLTKAAGIVKEPQAASQLEILTQILDDHKKWLNSDGKEGERADLQMGKLEGANLRQAVLRRANLRQAVLARADLQEADLQEADLQRANLREADLASADLDGADLIGVDLQEADLQRATLVGAFLQEADMEGAILVGADLRGAILLRAKLQKAYLQETDMRGTDLQGAKGLTVDQLAATKSLYKARLDPELEEKLRDKHPHLFDPPRDEDPPEDV